MMTTENVIEKVITINEFENSYGFILNRKEQLNFDIAKNANQKIKIKYKWFVGRRYLIDLVVFQ